MEELERRRNQAMEYLCKEKVVHIKRGDIVNSVLQAYRGDLELEYHRIHVKMDNEIATDLCGVTKEMYQLFFASFAEQHLKGNMQKVPNGDHRFHTTDLYRTLGRIISHAFILYGYWPIQISKATMVAALTSKVSENLVLESFLDMVSESERKVLDAWLHGNVEETVNERIQILGILSRFDCREDVNKKNCREILTSLAHAVVIYRVYYEILQLGQGVKAYQNVWTEIKEEHVLQLYTQALPNAAKVIASIIPKYTDDIDQRTMEEHVISYLENWINGLSPNQLGDLLVFWTASNVCVPGQVLTVEFNSMDGLARRPTSSTCSDTLNLSRVYFSAKDFEEDISIVFSKHSNVMDSV